MVYRVKNWGKFQHFKDRRPPWVKLYRDLLDDLEWFELEPVAAKNLVNLWLIASEYDGELPSIEKLAFRLRLKKQEVTKVLDSLSHWLEQTDISVISDRYQSDSTETETETETYQQETETKKQTPEYESVVNLYNSITKDLPKVKELGSKRKSLLKARWESGKEKQTLEFWELFFKQVADSDFLNGKSGNWKANLEWLLKEENFIKVLEGNYANVGASNKPTLQVVHAF